MNYYVRTIILAGGKGTRLYPVWDDGPKPMAPIHSKPFLYYLLNRLHYYFIDNPLISIGYRGNEIVEYFGHKYQYIKEETPLGTGGAIKKAISASFTLSDMINENFMIINGDTFFRINYAKLYESHIRNNADITIATTYKEGNKEKSMIHSNNDGFVERIERSDGNYYSRINAGVYIIDPHKFKFYDIPDKCSFEDDILPEFCKNGGKVYEKYFPYDYFIDIGIPEDYERCKKEWKQLTII